MYVCISVADATHGEKSEILCHNCALHNPTGVYWEGYYPHLIRMLFTLGTHELHT